MDAPIYTYLTYFNGQFCKRLYSLPFRCYNIRWVDKFMFYVILYCLFFAFQQEKNWLPAGPGIAYPTYGIGFF